jgi:putative membrane protein
MFESGLWWIFPLIMIILCFFMMSGRMRGMCGFGGHDSEGHDKKEEESALEILDKKYARGEIEREEYEEKKRVLTQR